MQWLVTLPIEIMAASLTLNFWSGARSVNPCVWVTIFLLAIVSINLFGVRGYGEAEFVFSTVKVIATLGFMYIRVSLDFDCSAKFHTVSLRWSLMLAEARRIITSELIHGIIRERLLLASKACAQSSSLPRSRLVGLNWWASLRQRRQILVYHFLPQSSKFSGASAW